MLMIDSNARTAAPNLRRGHTEYRGAMIVAHTGRIPTEQKDEEPTTARAAAVGDRPRPGRRGPTAGPAVWLARSLAGLSGAMFALYIAHHDPWSPGSGRRPLVPRSVP